MPVEVPRKGALVESDGRHRQLQDFASTVSVLTAERRPWRSVATLRIGADAVTDLRAGHELDEIIGVTRDGIAVRVAAGHVTERVELPLVTPTRASALSPAGTQVAIVSDADELVLHPLVGHGVSLRLDATDRSWLVREGTRGRDMDYARPSSLSFAEDGRTLFAAYGSARVLAWETATGSLSAWSDPLGTPPEAVFAVASLGTPNEVVIGDADGGIAVLPADLGAPRWIRAAHAWPVLRLVTLATVSLAASVAGDGTAVLSRTSDGLQLADLRAGGAAVTAVYLAPSGARAFVANRDGVVCVWDGGAVWRATSMVRPPGAEITALLATSNGALWIGTAQGDLQLWTQDQV